MQNILDQYYQQFQGSENPTQAWQPMQTPLNSGGNFYGQLYNANRSYRPVNGMNLSQYLQSLNSPAVYRQPQTQNQEMQPQGLGVLSSYYGDQNNLAIEETGFGTAAENMTGKGIADLSPTEKASRAAAGAFGGKSLGKMGANVATGNFSGFLADLIKGIVGEIRWGAAQPVKAGQAAVGSDAGEGGYNFGGGDWSGGLAFGSNTEGGGGFSASERDSMGADQGGWL